MAPFDFTCLHCGEKMVVSKKYGKIQCTMCGKFMDGTSPPDESEPVKQNWILGGLLYKGEMTVWMRTLIDSLRNELYQGDREAAMNTCQRLLDMDREFLDAHLWLARLHNDKTVQRNHLEEILALVPGNVEATRMLLVLDGHITNDEATRSADLYHNNVIHVHDPVATRTEALLCPICRGVLTIADNGHVTCPFCDYQDTTTRNAVHDSQATSLAIALIKQRGKAVRWQVGERMIHCEECGSERVLPAGKMSSCCPFCGSTHVVIQDALGAFRQPDGLLKFRVRQPEAEATIQAQLNSRVEKLKGIFIKNRVVRTSFEGVFLPFWAFDIFGTVIIREEVADSGGQSPTVNRIEAVTQLMNALVCGVKSPPLSLTAKLGRYDFSEVVPYTPKMLAKFAAELYSIDFDQASLDVRSVFRDEMKRQRANWNPNVKQTITTRIDHMDMRLLLLPVWVGTLTEEDGERRIALVNGQNGHATIGNAHKPG